MKQVITTITLVFLLSNINLLQAQHPDTLPWCPSGATWLYEYEGSLGRFYYLKLAYTHDTIINNTPCKALKANGITMTAMGLTSMFEWSQNPNFTYEYFANINDSIFYWQDGQFVFLYDFNATVGQKWSVAANPDFPCLDTLVPNLDTFTITSTSIQTYDNHDFETIIGTNNGNWSVGTTIVKNIGPMQSPYVIPIYNTCFYPDGNYAPLRFCCYTDDLRGTISFGYMVPGNCSFVMTPVEQIASNSSISIAPNPVEKELFIQNFQHNIVNYILYDIHGKVLVQQDYTHNFISLENYQTGLYFLVLKTDKGEAFSFKIVKMN